MKCPPCTEQLAAVWLTPQEDTMYPPTQRPAVDPLQLLEDGDRSDWTLLWLVVCSAMATTLLAFATSLHI